MIPQWMKAGNVFSLLLGKHRKEPKNEKES